MTFPPDTIAYSAFQQSIKDAAERLKPPQVKHPAINAFRHVEKAWRIREIDQSMAAFRAITAEEEAAAGVIQALRYRRYPGANKLNVRNHLHKASIWPIIAAVNNTIAEIKLPQIKYKISEKGSPRIDLKIAIPTTNGDPKDLIATPDEPLNMVMRKDGGSGPELEGFLTKLRDYINESGAAEISKHFSEQANIRNQILYASNEGLPEVDISDDFLTSRLHRVSVMVSACVLITQANDPQPFGVQCLEALRAALNETDEVKFDYPS